MAKFLKSVKWKKRCTAGLALALSATLSLGILSACGKTDTPADDETEEPSLPTDTQLIKNGDFEFYSEITKEEQDDRRTFINSPQSWSASSSSPSSDCTSGVVNTADWAYMSQSTFSLIQEADRKKTDSDGNLVDAAPGDIELTPARIAYATDNWDKASLYDRLEFYDFYKINSESGFELYDDYQYSITFKDVQYLAEDIKDKDNASDKGDSIPLHYKEGEEAAGSSVLMIHNRHYDADEKVSGTSKYYTSSTDVSLPAGAAAKVSVWVKTINLTHYDKVSVTKRGGAYISVTHNVGSTALDQMQINDIITDNAPDQTTNNGWQQYTVYIRANTFAATTFRIVLGLGRSTTEDRYEAIDGIALFDDLKCELVTDGDFEVATNGDSTADPAVAPVVPEDHLCTLTDKGEEKKFVSTDKQSGEYDENTNYALDLKAEFDPLAIPESTIDFGLTKEVSGSRTYTSALIDASLSDNREPAGEYSSILTSATVSDLTSKATDTNNGYLKNIVQKDLAKYPFGDAPMVLLLSTNGAAYTAKLPAIQVPADSRMLVSFWVKTCSILSGKSGAGVTLIDGENKVSIEPFDSTTVAKVDVNDTSKDIWNGWVQCFFFVENDSDVEKSFTLDLTYGPTGIASSTRSSYCDGYAAFANFQTYELTRAQYNYAATGTYAQKTTLTGAATDPSVFDSAAASGNTLEEGMARPANYTGALAGSNVLVEGGDPNPSIKQLHENYGIYAGMLSSEYAEKYIGLTAEEAPWSGKLNAAAGEYNNDANIWWKNLFGSNGSTANAAYQPLVLLNASGENQPSYGFYSTKKATLSANSASKISVRVKVAKGTAAYIYLIDVSGKANEGYNQGLKSTLPAVTYWYDDDGNIVNMDPDAKDFDEKGEIVYALQPNGLYKNNAKDTTDDAYYANLSNFEKDEEGNLVTTGGTPAYYFDGSKYYAYRDEAEDGTYTYRTEVKNLPAEGDIVRYPAAEGKQEAAIRVFGDDDENADKWITVSFYVQTGNADKQYRLELWAGQRDYDGETEGKKEGFPQDGYVFFDRCATDTVSNYSTLLDETEKTMLAYKDGEAFPYRDSEDEDKLAGTYGLYYTFTLYDSPDFLRYDADTDENGDGNPWRNYVQSEQEEALGYLFCEDMDGKVLGTAFPTVNMYLNYAVNEHTVDRAPSLNEETDEDEDTDDTTDSVTGDTSGNIWLYLASALLAVAILFAIGAVLFRKFYKKGKRAARVKAPKQPKVKTPKVKEEKAEAQKDEPAAPAPDENDPYNE